MHIFTYPLFFKFLYRYGNIPATILLLFYLYISASDLDKNLINIIPLLINLILLYLLNRHYLMLYKILPFRIETDNEKLIGSDFIFSSRKVTIFYKDIADLKGGIFEGKLAGVMKIYDRHTSQVIGFFNKIKDVEKLQTFILSRVNRSIYDAVIQKIDPADKKDKS